ncbi:hypothetical protein Lal_00014625 [Lupinus albus]|nr:hypothetical protein Lal_00014625 [Lupinus albus]
MGTAYQRRHLQRPLKEVSSRGEFRTYMLSVLISSKHSYSAVHLAVQLIHQRFVQHGPLVLESTPLKLLTPAIDRDRTVSRRSEPSSRATLMGEQPNPWDLLQPQDVTSRHRGAEPPRRCELLGETSLLSPEYLLSYERWPFHTEPPDHYVLLSHLIDFQAPLCHYTLRTVTKRAEGTFESLRYSFGGDHPSQTTHHAMSFRRKSIRSYSKGSQGLFVPLRVIGIFTDTTISPSSWLRQCPDRYTIRAGRNLPDKEFRYLRTSPVFLINSRLGLFTAANITVGVSSSEVIRRLFNVNRFGPPLCVTRASTCPWVDHKVSRLILLTIRPIQTRFRFGSGPEVLNLARVFSLGGWSPHIQTGFHVSRPTHLSLKYAFHIRGYHPLWLFFPKHSIKHIKAFGLIRFRSPLLTESLRFLFLRSDEQLLFLAPILLLRSPTSGTPSFHGLTGGVYKARERIHRAMADARLLAIPAS